MLNYVITIAISAFFVPHYIGGLFWTELKTAPGDIIGGALVIVVLAVINVVGVKESAGLNVFLAIVDFLTQLLLVAIGAILVLSPDTLADNVQLGIAPTWENFIISIPLGMIAYTGIETISNMAEEAKDEANRSRGDQPRAHRRLRDLLHAPRGRALGAAGDAARRRVPDAARPQRGGGRFRGRSDPRRRQADRPRPAPAGGELYVGLLAATILFIATNAAIIGVSRLVYSMGIHRQLPDGLRRLHPRYRTPWIGILVFAGVAILTLLPGQADFLGLMYAFGAMLSFTIAHASVIRLRLKLRVPRPYRGPGNVTFRGRDLPLFALVGGTATAGAFLATVALNPDVAVAGFSLARARPGRLSALPPPPGARPRLDPQGRDRAARRRPRGRVRLGARALRRRQL